MTVLGPEKGPVLLAKDSFACSGSAFAKIPISPHIFRIRITVPILVSKNLLRDTVNA